MLRDIFVATCMAVGVITLAYCGAWAMILLIWRQECREREERISAGYKHLLDDLVNGASDE